MFTLKLVNVSEISKMTGHLVNSGLTVKVDGSGVSRLTLKRSVGRAWYRGWRKFKVHLKKERRNLVAFFLGMLLATLYGVMALFLHKQPLWFCVYTTMALAVLAAFGMGLSAKVQVDVALMLPSLCSAHGKSFLLFTFLLFLVSGPLSNTLENTQRGASSLVCGAELAANQTRELILRSTEPLSSMMDKIREISSNAHAVAGRVRDFINAMTDSVRHVASTLRNVLHFLADIGDICNAKLGAPYRVCQTVLNDAWTDCSNLLGEFNFLCDVVNVFLPFCELARAGEVFCIVPSYVASHLKKRLAEPVVAAFEQMKREFDFSISASVNFDLDTSSSRSLQQMSQEVMKEVSSELQLFQKISEPLKYFSLVLLAWSFLRAMRYRRRYLTDLDFDNIYITAQFEEYDQKVASQGGVSVLPLSRKEAQTYITPFAFRLTARERRVVLVSVASVFRYLVMGGLLVALDFLVFWTLDQVHHQVKGDVTARAPVVAVLQVNGSGYASDIYRDLVAAFNILQGGTITVISRKCLVELSEPDYSICFILGFLLGLALLLSVTGGFVQRCRRLTCASYYPERELERIRVLHQKILGQRRTVGKALRASAAIVRAKRGAGAEGCGGCLHTLLLRLPGGLSLSHLLGLSPSVTCQACGEELRSEGDSVVACDVPHCTGLYCRPCFLSLGNACVVCTRPVTFQEDSEEELSASLNSSQESDEEEDLRGNTPDDGASAADIAGVTVSLGPDVSHRDRSRSRSGGSDNHDSFFSAASSMSSSSQQSSCTDHTVLRTCSVVQEPES